MNGRPRETKNAFSAAVAFLGVATLGFLLLSMRDEVAVTGFPRAAVYAAAAAAAWACAAFAVGLRYRHEGWLRSARRGVVAAWTLILFTTICLLIALLSDWYHVEYVWRTSTPNQPIHYKLSALWGGMSGSMLFWNAMLTSCGALMVWRSRGEEDRLTDYALGVMSVVMLFYAVLAAGLVPGISNPFQLLSDDIMARVEADAAAGVSARGMGMNPLLQTPLMMIHPPNLYAGFVVCTAPFAYAVGSMLQGSGSTLWLARSRRWTIAAWLFLTLGNLLGGAWAYNELGWGGYWGWDPVENAALLPWLMITAFLHSVMIQERRNMLKIWNIALISLTFLLVLFGTMLVRCGLLTSVHAFGESSELLTYFGGFLALSTIAVVWLMARRWRRLRSVNRFDSLLSKESAFLFNNWIFVISAAVVLAGTIFPIISEAYYTYARGIPDRKIAVSEPYYNAFIVPLGLILLALTGIGPMISWKKATGSNLRRNFLLPTAAGLMAALACVVPFVMIGNSSSDSFPLLKTIYSLLCVFASVFVLGTISLEYWKGVRIRLRRGSPNLFSALFQLTNQNRRRYGGYIVHIGVALFYVGALGSNGFQLSERVKLAPGETHQIAGYQLKYAGEPFEKRGPNAVFHGVPIEVSKNGSGPIAELEPSRGEYPGSDTLTYESATLRRLSGDLYIALGAVNEEGKADMQVYYNPLAWIVLWAVPIVMIIGGAVCLAERIKYRPAKGAEA